MKYILILILSLYPVNILFSQVEIDVVYPKQDSIVTAKESAFILGSVKPVDAQLYINDKHVKLYSNGAFIKVLPVEQGRFSFVCTAYTNNDTATVIRDVFIPYSLQTSSRDTLIIDENYIFPEMDWELYSSDVFKVACKGTPGCKTSFSIEGIVSDLPMLELPAKESFVWGDKGLNQKTPGSDPPIEGIYVGALYIQPWHLCKQSNITFRLINSNEDTTSFLAPGKISIMNSEIPRIGEFIKETIIPIPSRKRGTQLYFPKSTKVKIKAKRNHHYLIELSESEKKWIKTQNIQILPPGSKIQTVNVSTIELVETPKTVQLHLPMSQGLPYEIEQLKSESALSLTFYGVTFDSININSEIPDLFIKEIQHTLLAANIFQLIIKLNLKQQWGYNTYNDNKSFILEIKKPPEIAGWPSSPLKDIAVCLDPGHNPDLGAVGPTRLAEKDMTYKYCAILRALLEKKGAIVMLTREKNDGADLYTRPKLAEYFGADILLSLHFNALPDWADPFKHRGIGNYFYHPQSERLAYILQERLWKRTRLKDFGVFRENLVLCRPTNMIAVLIEPAFITHPEEEMLIQDMDYQKKAAEAIVEALEIFLKKSK